MASAPSTADLIRHLMDQHGLTRSEHHADLGTPDRVSEILRGKKGLSMAMVQRLRARFGVPRICSFQRCTRSRRADRQSGLGLTGLRSRRRRSASHG